MNFRRLHTSAKMSRRPCVLNADSLLAAQRIVQVDVRRPACGQIAGSQRHGGQKERSANEDQRIGGMLPRNSGGATPMMVNSLRQTTRVVPITRGSPLNRRFQRPWPITATIQFPAPDGARHRPQEHHVQTEDPGGGVDADGPR